MHALKCNVNNVYFGVLHNGFLSMSIKIKNIILYTYVGTYNIAYTGRQSCFNITNNNMYSRLRYIKNNFHFSNDDINYVWDSRELQLLFLINKRQFFSREQIHESTVQKSNLLQRTCWFAYVLFVRVQCLFWSSLTFRVDTSGKKSNKNKALFQTTVNGNTVLHTHYKPR